MKFTTLKADLLLLLAAVIWGSGFTAQRIGMNHVEPMTYTGARMAVGTLVLLPRILLRRRGGSNVADAHPASGRLRLFGGLLLGLVMFAGVSLQQYGLVHTTAGKAGFITGLYVVFVPLIGLFLRHRIGVITWIGVASQVFDFSHSSR